MIVMNETRGAREDAAGPFVGDPAELAEMAGELLSEVHNLTVAMARFEHAEYLAEEGAVAAAGRMAGGAVATAGSMPGGAEQAPGGEGRAARASAAVGEFIKRMVAKIVEYWDKFRAWLAAMVKNLRDKVMGPREDWLEAHRAELQGMTELGDAKANFGSALTGAAVANMPAALVSWIQNMLREVDEVRTADAARVSTAAMKVKLFGIKFMGKAAAYSYTKIAIGDVSPHEINRALVAEGIKVAEQSFENVNHIQQCMDAAAKLTMLAHTVEHETDQDEGVRHARIRMIVECGTFVAGAISGMGSINARANSIAMSALVTARAAGRRAAGRAEGGAAEDGAASPKAESASILDSFMPGRG